MKNFSKKKKSKIYLIKKAGFLVLQNDLRTRQKSSCTQLTTGDPPN